jgi:molecular chaperone DnaJ
MNKDYYQILGVHKEATETDIKKAYRKLAMQYHPDKNQGNKAAEEKFREIASAYEILGDPQKRAAYDQYGNAAFDQNGGFGHGGGQEGFSGFGGFGFSDFLDEMFGERSQQQNMSGSDILYNLEISLEEAFFGTTANLKFSAPSLCDTCKGSGSEKNKGATSCGVCKGRGKVRMQQGFFTIERTCHACEGAGQVIKDPCKTCKGGGRVKKNRHLEVKVPAGIEEGMRIRVAGEGEAGARGAHPGDLYVVVKIKNHKFFRRKSQNIHCRIPIQFTKAALGGDIEVPTIDGSKVNLKIPQGTQTGQQLRLRNQGMSILQSKARGDMIIEVFVEVPINLTKNQKELLEQFESNEVSHHNNPESAGFFAKVKEFWDDLSKK